MVHMYPVMCCTAWVNLTVGPRHITAATDLDLQLLITNGKESIKKK